MQAQQEIDIIQTTVEQNNCQRNQQAQQSWWSSTTTWMKRKYFNGAHLLDLAFNDEKSQNLSLFGMKFKSNEEARILYSTILWFTYRENLKFYKIKREFTIKSDVGWGCMVRVGQMMLAQCLRLNKGAQYWNDPQEIQKILKEFISQDGKYSVQKIAQKAFQIYGLKPGDWYSPSEIAHVMCELQNQNLQSNLKALVFDAEFQWTKAIQFFDQNRSKKQKLIQKVTKKSKKKLLNIRINPGLIIILFRIGYKAPQKDMLQIVINFLREQRNCIGMLGGRPGKAHYIFGTSQKNFIYLDPHCVKDTNDIDSFFCTKMFSIPHQSIDPCIGLCFFVRNTAELLHLYDKFQSQKKQLPFYNYAKSQMPLIVEKQEVEQGFEQLKIQR